MKLILISILTFGFSGGAYAEFFPFNHDIQCQSKQDESKLTIRYDKTEYLEFGRQGGIHIEFNVGIGEISQLTQTLGIEKPFRRTLRISGAAGQVGNFIEQNTENPLQAIAIVTFKNWELLSDDGKVEKEYRSFIATVKLSEISETGFPNEYSNSTTQKYLQLKVSGGLDGFGTYYERFTPSECKLLK